MTSRRALRIGLIPGDGIGREVIPVSAYFCILLVDLFRNLACAQSLLSFQ